jgi:hypothetical protein
LRRTKSLRDNLATAQLPTQGLIRMKRMFFNVLAGVCLIPVSATAGPITISDFHGVELRYTYENRTSRHVVLGSVEMSNGSGISAPIDGRLFEAYCIDIHGPIFNQGMTPEGGEYDATAALMSGWDLDDVRDDAGRYVAWMYNEYAEGIAGMGNTAAANLARSGLQMAIWNTLFDADDTVDGGLFSVHADFTDVRNAANGYISELIANLPEAALSDATWLQLQDCGTGTCVDAQDFIGPLAMSATPVPEPGTLLLLASGLVAGGWHRRRRGSAAAID